jgi:DNA-binding winged helix-turn-helix (wHTH) protein
VRIRFGACTFDPESRQVFRGNTEVHLSPKAFELLKILVQRRPQALSKPQLQQLLWPDTFVCEANLPLLVGEVRRALDDGAQRQRFIRTLPRFGYAFCGTVTEMSGEPRPIQSRGVVCWLVWKRQRLELAEGENLIGRDPQARVYLDFPSVSRHHARITLTGTDAKLEDLTSKNGTFVRGVRVTVPSRLGDGDRIRFGSVLTTFRICSHDTPTETTPVR